MWRRIRGERKWSLRYLGGRTCSVKTSSGLYRRTRGDRSRVTQAVLAGEIPVDEINNICPPPLLPPPPPVESPKAVYSFNISQRIHPKQFSALSDSRLPPFLFSRGTVRMEPAFFAPTLNTTGPIHEVSQIARAVADPWRRRR